MSVAQKSGRLAIAALGLIAASWTGPVKADTVYFPNQPGGVGDNSSEDIDFTTSSIPSGASGVISGLKYWVVNLSTYNSNNQCFDVYTVGTGGDTRIWVYDMSISDYRSLNDDFSGLGLYSHARIWIAPPSNGGRYASFIVTGYSSYYNSMQFTLRMVKMPASTTESQCSTGYPTFETTGSGDTFINAS